MQDQAIIQIGKLRSDPNRKPYQNFISNLFPGKNYHVILAVFDFTKVEDDYECAFNKVDIESASKKNYLKFAYRKGSPRGGDITFTTKFGDINKKFKTFYPKQVNDVIAFAKENEEETEVKIFSALKSCLEVSGEAIKDLLRTHYESLDQKQQVISGFSLRFNGLEGKSYLEDFSSIQKILYNTGTAGKSNKYKVISEGHNETCSICLEKKPIVHGFASPFKYATVDKPSLVSGFFNQKNNWKNYPICSDCALDFELGKKYVTQQLSKYFYGKSYYIIPKVAVGSNPALLKKALSVLEDLEYKEKEGEKIAAREEYLMRKIGKEEGDHNQFAFNLVFYEENPTTKAMKIKLFLEEIFPSRFRTLFVDVPKVVN
ncbi:MAG: TM1802 family CRISPR-associated protein, partial [Bacteroidota bacterium]